MNAILSQQNKFLEELVEKYIFPETVFVPDAVHSQLQQREAAKINLIKYLKNFQQNVELFSGIKAILFYLESVPITAKEIIKKDLAKLASIAEDQLNFASLPLNFSQLFEISSETISFIYEAALKEKQEKRWLDASGVYAVLTLLCSNNPYFWFERGWVNYQSKNYEAALFFYQIALQLEPDEYQIYLFLTAACIDGSFTLQAKEIFKLSQQLFASDEEKKKKYDSLIKKIESKISKL